MKTRKKILITGGHVTPAIALIDKLKQQGDADIVFIGRPQEYHLITEKGIRFLPLMTGRVGRTFTRHWLPSLLKIPFGFAAAMWYVLGERPSLVVSFGGYIAFPVALSAWILRVPILTHEQTRAAGLTNRIIGRIAKRVCVAYEDMIGQFPKGKAVYTGLPMRKELFAPSKTAPYPAREKTYPVLYITGGSLGAQSLNRLIYPIIAKLTQTWTVIHQVGAHSLADAKKIRDPRYIAEAYISVEKLSWVLHHAVMVMGRSGANTTMELAALGKVAILIPLPWAGANEQQLNAEWLGRRGGAWVLPQKGLTPAKILSTIAAVWRDRGEYQKRATTLAPAIYRDGDTRMVREINALLP